MGSFVARPLLFVTLACIIISALHCHNKGCNASYHILVSNIRFIVPAARWTVPAAKAWTMECHHLLRSGA